MPSLFPRTADVLPRNARPLTFDTDEDVAWLLHRGDDVSPIATEAIDVVGSRRGAALLLPTLTAGEIIALERSCAACEGEFPLSFTVDDEDDLDAPAIVVGTTASHAVYDGEGVHRAWNVSASFSAADVDEPLLLRVDGSGLQGFVATTPAVDVDGPTFSAYLDADVGPRPCIDVTAVDVAGNESARVGVCFDLVEPEGCTQSSTSSSFGLFGLVLLLVRRRR